MQSTLDNMDVDVEGPEGTVAETQAGTVTQQAYEDEMERLLEENEDLKVWWIVENCISMVVYESKLR